MGRGRPRKGHCSLAARGHSGYAEHQTSAADRADAVIEVCLLRKPIVFRRITRASAWPAGGRGGGCKQYLAVWTSAARRKTRKWPDMGSRR